MNIFIRVKAAGRRRDVLEKQPAEIPDTIDSAEKLIERLVRKNVRAYNEKKADAPLFRYLSGEELENGALTGKIGFGDRKNERDQDEEAAVRNALQCFNDGIYRVLINDTEALPGGLFVLREEDTVTFMRLVMLAGSRF